MRVLGVQAVSTVQRQCRYQLALLMPDVCGLGAVAFQHLSSALDAPDPIRQHWCSGGVAVTGCAAPHRPGRLPALRLGAGLLASAKTVVGEVASEHSAGCLAERAADASGVGASLAMLTLCAGWADECGWWQSATGTQRLRWASSGTACGSSSEPAAAMS